MTRHQRLGLCFLAVLGSVAVAFLIVRDTFYLLNGLPTRSWVMLIVGVTSVLATEILLLDWTLEKLFGDISGS